MLLDLADEGVTDPHFNFKPPQWGSGASQGSALGGNQVTEEGVKRTLRIRA
jgi:hypothetical protein